MSEGLLRVVSTDQTRPNLTKPFGRTVWGQRWLCASNGYMVVMVRSDTAPDDWTSPSVEEVFPKTWEPTHTAQMSALVQFAGTETLDASKKCTECRGTKRIEHYDCDDCFGHPCDECDGTGQVLLPPDSRPGLILQATVNKNMICHALASAPASGTVYLRNDAALSPIIMMCDDWCAAIMPLRYGTIDGTLEVMKVEARPLLTWPAEEFP